MEIARRKKWRRTEAAFRSGWVTKLKGIDLSVQGDSQDSVCPNESSPSIPIEEMRGGRTRREGLA
jgi:hypothetical protein